MDERDERFRKERKELIASLISGGYLKSKNVIDAMLSVPRHEFLPENRRTYSYNDSPISIGFGQTISAPHMVAMMTEYLDVKPEHKILEIGSGSGYQAAILAELANKGKIITVERIKELADFARENLNRLKYKNVEIIHWEGTRGYEKEAPYDRIIVTAAAPKIPDALIEQLKNNGKMLIPVGGRMMQTLLLVEKKNGKIKKRDICGCVFVPLIGKNGW